MPNVFDGVHSLEDLQAKIAQMVSHPQYAGFAGFLWEYVVAKYFLKFGEHHTVNVCEYRQTYAGSHGEDADYGLDGYGVDILGKYKIICQVKYRAFARNKIGQEHGNPDKANSLTTFVNEICRNLQENPKLIVLLCTTSDEFVKHNDRKTMEKVPFADKIKKELKSRNVEHDQMKMKIYDLGYWSMALKNPRFWDFVRSEFSI